MWSQNSNNIEEIAEVDDKFGYSLAALILTAMAEMTWLSAFRLKIWIASLNAGAVNVIYGVAGTTFLNSGLGATVPVGGSGRSDQLWSQESPGN